MYQMANALIALGVQPGDRVAMLPRNCMAYSELFAATLVVGACAVPMQSMITDESLALMLKDSGAKALVLSQDFAHMAQTALADQGPLLSSGLMGFDFGDDDHVDLKNWLAQQSTQAPGIEIDPDGEFNSIYSSGTTGVPKGIMHSHRTRQGLAKGLMRMGITTDAVTLISTPLYSNTTITTRRPILCAGGTLIIMSKFDAQGALELIDQHKVTHVMLVGAIRSNYAPAEFCRLRPRLNAVFSTSAPLRAALKADVIDSFSGEIVEFYGLTEGGVGTLFIGSVARSEDKLGSVGPAMPGAILKIIDDKGNEAAVGEPGDAIDEETLQTWANDKLGKLQRISQLVFRAITCHQ